MPEYQTDVIAPPELVQMSHRSFVSRTEDLLAATDQLGGVAEARHILRYD